MRSVVKPPVNVQGKAVVERCWECDDCQEVMVDPRLALRGQPCTNMLVMLPDGTVKHARTPRIAERKVRDWYKREMNVDAVNIGLIEWRHHIRPPYMGKQRRVRK